MYQYLRIFTQNHQYVTELTYILFLKMAKETGAEKQIPEGYRWDVLKSKSGVELKKFYKELLNHLGENCTGRVREIYQGWSTVYTKNEWLHTRRMARYWRNRDSLPPGLFILYAQFINYV